MYIYRVWKRYREFEYCRIYNKNGDLIAETKTEKNAIIIVNALNNHKGGSNGKN